MTETSSRPRAAHVPALDGLRGLAVLCVVLFHTGVFQFGWLGVPLFFVLSGHFITRTLLRRQDLPRGARARDFFRNRALRLAPLYLMFCAGLTVLALTAPTCRSTLEDLPYLWTWIYDLRPLVPGFAPNPVATYDHMWSLGVEVQLYLIWSLLALTLPRRWFVRTAVTLALAGPVLRVLFMLVLVATGFPAELRELAVYSSPVSYLDAFAIGACTALPEVRAKLAVVAEAALVVFAMATIGVIGHTVGAGQGFPADLGYPILLSLYGGWIWQYSVIALFGGALVHFAGEAGRLRRLLSARWLSRVGLISYGIYVLHIPVVTVVGLWVPPGIWTVVTVLAVTYVLAELSYRFLESPFLRLKRGSLAQSLAAEPEIALAR